MKININHKEIEILFDALNLLESTIKKRKRVYEKIEIKEIEELRAKINLSTHE